MKDLVVIGSGGFSKQVIEMLEKVNIQSSEYKLIGVIDDNREILGTKILGYEVIGDTDFLQNYSSNRNVYGIIAIADGRVRKHLSEKLNHVTWINLIHPNAIVSDYVNLGEGNIVCAGAVINPDCILGNHCHINIGTTIGHDVSMEDYVTVMPGSRVSGNVKLMSYSMIGSGSIILQGLIVEEQVELGAGAVLTKNTKCNNTYIGIPAREVSKRSK